MHRRLSPWSIFLLLFLIASTSDAAARPNVILVITDDQGYGDLGAHGNSMIQTPNLDKLHKQSVRLTDYHVDPTCSPTRAALMTGRYSTRTGVWHTIMGRSIMESKEVTVAEVFKSGGYKTGMFGKWHLGDNYPCRPQDQGFDLAFYHGGGGVGQTPDVFGNDYFDDTYFRNGVKEKTEGYCTDVWFREATKFIKSNKDEPFFVYLSTNAPHGPYLVAEKYSKLYRDKGVPGSMAPFYGMITNIDENLGRLMAKLDELELAENTILIFTTDNGTAAGGGARRKPAGAPAAGKWTGFNAGMRGKKGSEYDGGHRVPFFVRWPAGKLTGGRDVDTLTAHIDVLPTLAELCGIEKPKDVKLDGRSMVPLLRGGDFAWPDRTLLVHSQRIEHPQKGRKCSVMTERFRLVNGKELYDITTDPSQQKNVAADYPDEFKKLSKEYDAWWKSLSTVFDDYVRIGLGAEQENPANLTCHDWHGNAVPWHQNSIRSGAGGNGFWAVNVERDGKYEITLRRWPKEIGKSIEAVSARLQIGEVEAEQQIAADATASTFKVDLKKGPTRLQTWLKQKSGKQRGAYFVEVRRVEDS
jgi:arylsulfatase A-like enzyme